MFLIKNNNIVFLIFLIFFHISKLAIADDNNYLIKKELAEYLSNTSEISSNFIQINDNSIQEGKFYLKKNRLRIEYEKPSKIIIVVKKNKAMYFNVDLQEVQYFNPKNTVAEFFFNLFYDNDFLNEAKFTFEKNSFNLAKSYEIDDEQNIIKIFFEKSPLSIRKIEVKNSNGKISFGIINLNYNPNLSDKIFSLANPLLS